MCMYEFEKDDVKILPVSEATSACALQHWADLCQDLIHCSLSNRLSLV